MPREKRPLRAVVSFFATGWRLALPTLVGAGATLIVGAASAPTAEAKSPGTRYCFHGLCHRVGTLSQTDTLVGWRGYLLASYYDSCRLDRLNPCGLSEFGAVFRPDLPDNAASPLLPDGTVILAYNPKTGDASVLRVTNAGPYSGKRKLDVRALPRRSSASASRGWRRLSSASCNLRRRPRRATCAGVYTQRFRATLAGSRPSTSHSRRPRSASTSARTAALAARETAALENGVVPRPQLAVSPSLARELVMLRSPPRPASRGPRLVQGPRLVSRAAFKGQQSSGLQRLLPEPSAPTSESPAHPGLGGASARLARTENRHGGF